MSLDVVERDGTRHVMATYRAGGQQCNDVEYDSPMHDASSASTVTLRRGGALLQDLRIDVTNTGGPSSSP